MKDLLDKVLAALCWVWTKLRALGSMKIDLPPIHLKWIAIGGLVCFLATFAWGLIIGFKVDTWVKDQFGWGEMKMQPLAAMPRLQSVVTTTMAPPAEVKSDAKVAPVTAPKAPKAKRKAKKEVSTNILGF